MTMSLELNDIKVIILILIVCNEKENRKEMEIKANHANENNCSPPIH